MSGMVLQPSHRAGTFGASGINCRTHTCPCGGARRMPPLHVRHSRQAALGNRVLFRSKLSCQASTGPGTPGYRRPATPQRPRSPRKPGSPKRPGSPNLTDKQIDVTVYQPSGAKSTEKRTVKLDQEEVSKVKEPEAAKTEPTEAPKGGSSEAAAVQQYSSMIGPEASTYAAEADAASAGDKTASNAEKGADEAATNFEEGADQAADAVQDGLNQFSEDMQEGADQLQKGADELDQNATEVRQELEQNLEEAADAAADKAADVLSQAQAAAQGAADSASSFVDSLQKGSQTGSPYQDQLLTSMEPNPYGSGASDDEPSAEDQVQYFKLRLLECIAGLDRGFSASSNAAAQVESAVLSLTGQSEPVSLSWTPAQGQEEQASGLAQLSGTWRLVYSSGFASGRYGSQQPSFPGSLGQVYQVISPYTSRLDNVLELVAGLPGLPPVVCTVTLKHHFEALGGNIVQITVEDTEVKVTGGLGGILGNLPDLVLPQLPEPLRPSRQQRTSSFDVLYLDDNMRIIRGSRGELRIFVKT